MLQLLQSKTLVPPTNILDALRKEFDDSHCLVLDHLISDQMSKLIELNLGKGSYKNTVHSNQKGNIFGEELTLNTDNNLLKQILFMLMNRDEFLNTIGYITGIKSIKSFQGRIYKLLPNEKGFLKWHNDIVSSEKRLIGMSLNLSNIPYEGGHFILRNKETQKQYRDIYYTDWGTAHIFRIDPTLQHCVTQVLGDNPRIAYAGWFYESEKISEFTSI